MERIAAIIQAAEKVSPPLNAPLDRVHETFVRLYNCLLENSNKDTIENQEKTLLFAVRVTKFYLQVKKRHPDVISHPALVKEMQNMATQAVEIADSAKVKLMGFYKKESENRPAPSTDSEVPKDTPNKPPPAYPDIESYKPAPGEEPSAPIIPSPTESSSEFKNIYMSPTLISEFIALSEANTKSDIETNGTLAGCIENSKIIIKNIVLCKQEGTANSCQTFDEHEMVEFLINNNLTAFGWIHTHPSQSAFLSSVDLHTQLYYQSNLPESIAIVIAPKYSEAKFFSLTKYGLDFLKNCKKEGFHDHASTQGLFEEAKHVFYDQGLPGKCIDFRGKN